MAGRPKREVEVGKIYAACSKETKERYFNCRARCHQSRNGDFLQRLLDIIEDISEEAIQQANDHDRPPEDKANVKSSSVEGMPETDRMQDIEYVRVIHKISSEVTSALEKTV
eukprot:gene16026-7371_t